MIQIGTQICPDCGGKLKGYDHVKRIAKSKNGTKRVIDIRRLRCGRCKKLHRELPDFLLPYKQYEADIVEGVKEGLITSETLGFEDYPCEVTMARWQKEK